VGDDAPRFLGRVGGYTPVARLSIDPLEAVDEAEQERQTAWAHHRRQAQLVIAWTEAQTTIRDALDAFRDAGAPLPGRVVRNLHFLDRSVRSLDRIVRE
jgi:hypothetical protein